MQDFTRSWFVWPSCARMQSLARWTTTLTALGWRVTPRPHSALAVRAKVCCGAWTRSYGRSPVLRTTLASSPTALFTGNHCWVIKLKINNMSKCRAPGRVGAGGGREFGMGVARLGAAHHLEDHLHPEPAVSSLNHTRAPAFNADRYTSSVYDRVTDFSPVNSDYSNEFGHPAATQMAGIADIGSRSRKLIEDINTSSSYQPNDKYASRSNYGYR